MMMMDWMNSNYNEREGSLKIFYLSNGLKEEEICFCNK